MTELNDLFHVDDNVWFARHPHAQHRMFPTTSGSFFVERDEERDGPAIEPFDSEQDEIDAALAAKCRAWDRAREETAKARSKEHISFDEALDWVIDYLGDERKDYGACSPTARRNHIWRAVQVLMRHRGIAD